MIWATEINCRHLQLQAPEIAFPSQDIKDHSQPQRNIMTRTESLFRNPELKMEFKGPYRLDSIQQYKNELDQFGLYFITDALIDLSLFTPIRKEVVYIGRAPYSGIYNRLNDHRNKITNSELKPSSGFYSFQQRIGANPQAAWAYIALFPSDTLVEDIVYAEVAYLQKYMRSHLHHDRPNGKQLPECNRNDI